LLIEKLKITIKKLRHEQFGQSSERGSLLDQLELQLADLEENAAHAETAALLGQLTLLWIIDALANAEGVEVISANTDGITLKVRRDLSALPSF